jgi:hypothetical protein
MRWSPEGESGSPRPMMRRESHRNRGGQRGVGRQKPIILRSTPMKRPQTSRWLSQFPMKIWQAPLGGHQNPMNLTIFYRNLARAGVLQPRKPMNGSSIHRNPPPPSCRRSPNYRGESPNYRGERFARDLGRPIPMNGTTIHRNFRPPEDTRRQGLFSLFSAHLTPGSHRLRRLPPGATGLPPCRALFDALFRPWVTDLSIPPTTLEGHPVASSG